MDVTQREGECPQIADLDRFLARCVAAYLRSQPAPEWNASLDQFRSAAEGRSAYHGIALLLTQHRDTLASWPAPLAEAVRDEARRQSFWETSHRQAIAGVLDALHRAGIEAAVMKGSALAYSLYDEPALRRRGDSDIVIVKGARATVRRVLRDCGFHLCQDIRALQESWQASAPPNFTHQIDLHWRINSSAAMSGQLEQIDPYSRLVPLARLSPHARGLAPVDNLLLTCLNRTAHAALGYKLGSERLFDGDRLIWAVDIDLIASSLSPGEWDQLTERARASGTAKALASGLAFAQRVCATPVAAGLLERLAAPCAAPDLTGLFDPGAAAHRLRLDLAATTGLAGKLRLIRYTLLPAPQFLRERFPDASHWPTALLALRRLAVGATKLLRRNV